MYSGRRRGVASRSAMTDREVDRALRALAPVDAARTEAFWQLWVASAGRERDVTAELLDILAWQVVARDFREGVWLPPPAPAICAGEFALGTVLYPGSSPYCAVGLRAAELLRHLLIVGSSGSGKTHWALQLVRQLHAARIPFLVFDWKRNYRELLQLPECADLVVLTVGREVAPFRFNPLIPPRGVLPGMFFSKLVDVLQKSYWVGQGVEFLLRRAIDYVYETCGFFNGATTEMPTFTAVRAVVQKQRLDGRMGLWKASALRVLESLCFRHGLGPVVNGVSTDVEALLQRPVVLELDALGDADKTFLTEALILWLYEYRKQQAVREVFSHALLIEEAHHILSAAKERAAGAETITETCLRQIREFGEAVIVLDQEPSKLSHSIKANTATTISFALGSGRDVADVAPSLGLDAETAPWLHRLPVGQAIVSIRPRIGVPVLVGVPAMGLRKGVVRDADLARQSSP